MKSHNRSSLSLIFPIFFLIFAALMTAPKLMPGQSSQASPSNDFIAGSAPFPNFDIRAEHYSTLDPTTDTSVDRIKSKQALGPGADKARASLETNLNDLQRNVRGLQVRWNSLQETPHFLFSYDEPLTEPSSDPTEQIARRFLGRYRALYGLRGDEVERLKVVREYSSAHNGARHLTFQQEQGGLQVFGAEARFTLTRDGRIVSVASDLVPGLVESINSLTPELSAREALRLAAANVGITLAPSVVGLTRAQTPDRATTFSAGEQFESEPSAKLTLFPLSHRHTRLAWQVRLIDKHLGDSYAIFVDAGRGTILLRHNLTWYFGEQTPNYRVFTSNTPQPNLPFVSLSPPFVDRQLIATNGDPVASPLGWVDPANPTTMGNNIVAQVDRDGSNMGGFRPTVTDSNFDFPLVLETIGAEPEQFPSAAVTNLFYRCNLVHDYLYKLGFDEAAGNFQVDNFGRGGLGNDPVIADAQDGGGFNNANFSTSEDGSPGNRMQMYLWKTATPKIDGDYDAEVIVHEYVHGLTTRLVGGPQNVVSLFGLQSGGMGEGWSDWYAMTILSKPGDDPRARYPYGSYVTHNFDRGIRRFPYSTDLGVNPLTYADLDPTQTQFKNVDVTEVHKVGEIWCEALWEVRANFIDAYGFEHGKQLIEQLVTDALKLTPTNPTFVDGRDAILLADQLDNGGVNQCLIWRGFAHRGVGFSAASINGSSSNVRQAFDLPPYCQRTGAISLDRKGYTSGDTIKINLGDADLIGQGSARVTVTSAATGDSETLALRESTQIPGQFLGTIMITFAAAVPNDGVLQSALGDTFTVSYDDASTEQGTPAQATATARAVRAQVLLNDAIENGPGNFVPGDNWMITKLASHSPTHSWLGSFNGAFKPNTSTSLKVRKVNLSGLIGSRLVFWQRYNIKRDFDFGFVEIKVGQQPWVPVASFTGQQPDFRETTVDLSRFDGQGKVRLRFRLVTDGSTVADSWFVDDVQIASGATN